MTKIISKNQIIVFTCILVVIAACIAIYFGRSAKIQQSPDQISISHQQGNVREIEENAIESYLYVTTLQAFQIAQAAGVESKEYRDYEQKYAEYRTFRDNRIRNVFERHIR